MSRPDQDQWTSAGESLAMVVGIVMILAAVLGVSLGGEYAVFDLGRRDAAGLVTSDKVRLATGGYALTTDDQTVATTTASIPRLWMDQVRVRVEADQGAAVFVGIAPTSVVRGYLSGVAHTTITRIGEIRPVYDHPGGRPGQRPGDVPIWHFQTAGTGEQTLTWPVHDGDWTLVVMRADGGQGLSVRTDVGATAPVLRKAWIVALSSAGMLLGLGTLLVVAVVVRRPQAGPSALPRARSRRSNESKDNHGLKGRS